MVTSPGGGHVASQRWVEGVRTVVVQPLGDLSKAVVIPRPRAAERLIRFVWVNDERLLITYRVRLQDQRFDHQFTFRRDGEERIRIAPFCENMTHFRERGCHRYRGAGYLIDVLPDDPEHVLISGFMNTREAHVWKTNVATGESTMVQDKLRGITTWRLDHDHQVRLGYGSYLNNAGEVETQARLRTADNGWIDKSEQRWVREHWWPIALDDASGFAYGAELKDIADTWRILRFDLHDDTAVETVAQSPRYDLSGIVIDQRMVGYGPLGQAGPQKFIDPTWADLQRRVQGAFPGTQLSVRPTSARERFVHMRLDTRGASARHLLWDRRSNSAVSLGQAHPDVPADRVLPSRRLQLSSGLEIVYTPPAGAQAPSPAIVIPRGGPAALASPGFDYLVQALASRGYAVIEVNLRGASLAGRRFIDTLAGRWRRTMHEDLTEALSYTMEEGLTDRPPCVLGEGAAAYVALMDAIEHPARYGCLVTINGIVDLSVERREESYDLASQRYIESRMGFDANALSGISPRRRSDELAAPILIVHAVDDDWADIAHARNLRKGLRRRGNAQFVELARGGHGVENTQERLRLLEAVLGFLDAHLTVLPVAR